MSFEYVVIIEEDEDGWLVASCPALRGCHTQAKTMNVLLERIKKAIALCIKAKEPRQTSQVRGAPGNQGRRLSRLTPLKTIQIIRILAGLDLKRSARKEVTLTFATPTPRHGRCHPQGRRHRKGLVRKILQDIDMDWEDFIKAK